MTTWTWQRIHPGRPAMSGELGKQFKNEAIKQPGVTQVGAPPPEATVLSREAIQNSWDAGRVLQADLESKGLEAPPFVAKFVYRSLVGDEKARVSAALGLSELTQRASKAPRRDLGIAESDCLDHVDDLAIPLSLLILEERGTIGMEGSWQQSKSKMSLALMSSGMTAKGAGAGGSYGYGKAGLIRGSAPRVVVAHTCFRESDDEPGVTRRLLGATYWGDHRADDQPFTGFALLGQHESDDLVAPLENAAADALASELGLMIRDPASYDELGSSFLLVEPTVSPVDLRKAIERNWWPAILDGLIDITIETATGEVLHPRPRKNEVLHTFIRGYELATTQQDNQSPQEARKNLSTYTPVGGSTYALGHLGMHADLAGWSYTQGAEADEDEEGAISHKSLIALIRGPRMVVEYYEAGRGQPFVRGAFVADPSVDDRLRQTEPKAHDAWQTTAEEGTHPDASKVAAEVLKRIRGSVRDFKKQLRPPPPREQDIRLPLLDDLFRNLLENKGPKNPPVPQGDPRPIAIGLRQGVEAAPGSGSLIRLAAVVDFHLTEHVDAESAAVRLGIRYVFDEDGSRGDDCSLAVQVPDGFEVIESDGKKGTVITGDLTTEKVSFVVHSEPYDPDWSTQLIVSADLDQVDASVVPPTATEAS